MTSRLTPESTTAAVRHLRRRDALLKKVIDRVGPCRLKRQTNRYQSLLKAIIAQQISGAAARSIWNRLVLAAETPTLTAQAIAGLPDAALRAAGVSPQKLSYVRDLTNRVLAGDVRLHALHRRSDDDVVAELIRIKGIGVWTAQMFLMFSLGRPDVLPHGDLGIQTAIRTLYGLSERPNREICHEIAAPWRPYATVACWYLWRSTEVEP